ncbi:hypothetical protein BDN67DRAFT_976211 [Paxillus ammoniavirescens]|nr:hypothetical protein BDN67DRAFT_976211 [Paxillus ammoniavirescens]
MSSESPPYDAVVGPTIQTPGQSATAAPFTRSRYLVGEIQGLVSSGKSLDSHFKDIRDIASAAATFEYKESALGLCQNMTTLLWDSRRIAGVVLAAVEEFNENILGFLSYPNVGAQGGLDELVGLWKVLQANSKLAAEQNAAFDQLLADLKALRGKIPGAGDLDPKSETEHHPTGKSVNHIPESGGLDAKSKTEHHPTGDSANHRLVASPSRRTSLWVAFRTVRALTTGFRRTLRVAEGLIPSRLSSPKPLSGPAGNNHILPKKSARNHPRPAVNVSQLPVRLDALLGDLRAFTDRINIFSIVLKELERERDIFVLYLEDEQSVTHQVYKSEVERLQMYLPDICNALDAYSKGRNLSTSDVCKSPTSVDTSLSPDPNSGIVAVRPGEGKQV